MGGANNTIAKDQGFLLRGSTIGTTSGITSYNKVRINLGATRFTATLKTLLLHISGKSGSDEALLHTRTKSMEKVVSLEAVTFLSTGDGLLINAIHEGFK